MLASSTWFRGACGRVVALAISTCALGACDSGDSSSNGGSAGSGASGGSGGSGGETGTTAPTGGSGGSTASSGGSGGGGNAAAPSDALFAPDGIATIELTLGQVAVDGLWAAPSEYVHGDIKVTLAGGDSLSIPDIGVRLKGKYGSFRTLDQKSAFLLNIDKFDKAKDLLGLEKLALNNMVQDPSMIHEQIAYALFREAGVPAPRTSYARVFVNGELYGLYTTVEVLDNSLFLEGWYGDSDGNMYEGEYGSDLENGLLQTFDLDNGDDNGFSDLQTLTDTLDSLTAPDTFYDDASTVFDMDEYLQFSATEIFIGHWDGYAWTRNNYYIYHAPDGRWRYMPWGTDQTFADYLEIWGGGGRLQQMCDASLPCRQKLKDAFAQVSARVTTLGLVARCDSLLALIDTAMQEDPRKEYDAGTVYAYVEGTKDYLLNRPGDVAGQFACADPTGTDNDGDGAFGCGYDCDDNNPDVYPGGPEQCNLQDDNCNGEVDDDPMCPGCVTAPASGGGTLAFCFKPKTFTDAEADCVAQGGHLVSIHSQAQQDEVVSGAYSVADGEWWIGFTDVAEEGNFIWTDGSPVDFQTWNDGEPNNYDGVENCAHLASWAGGIWNDIGCDSGARYVCKLP